MMAGPLAPHVLAAQGQDANMAPSHLESHLIEYDEKLLGPRIDSDGRPIVRSEGKHPAGKIPPEEGMPSERDLRQMKEHLNKLLNPTSAPAITAFLAPITAPGQLPAPAY